MSRPSQERALFWTMVVACFTAALVALGARAADRVALAAQTGQQSYLIVRVLSPDGDEGLNAALSTLGAEAAVAEARVMSQARAAALLEGAGVEAGALPTLRLIEVTLTPAAALAPGAADDLGRKLAAQGVEADTIGAPTDDAALAAAQRMRRAALVGSVGLAAIMALIVLLAARALAARRRDEMTVLADLGATRAEACLPVADEAGASGFAAGLLGAVGAGAAALAAILAIAPDFAGASLEQVVAPADVAPLLAAPFLAALAAGVGARLGAESLYARAARLR